MTAEVNGEIHQQTVNIFTVETGGKGEYIPGDADGCFGGSAGGGSNNILSCTFR